MRTKIWIESGQQFAIGEGGVDLLAEIVRWNSLARAAQEVGWSYRHAWGYVRRAETTLGLKLTQSISGKGRDRGMTLTEAGRGLVQQLSVARERVREAAAAELSKLAAFRRS